MNAYSAKGAPLPGVRTPFDETRSLYHYLGVIRKRRWILIAAVSASLLIAFVASFLFPYEYRAKSTVQIERERADFYSDWQHTGTDAEYKTYYLTQLETLTSSGLARRVIEDLQLWEHDEFSPAWKRLLGSKLSENAVIEAFRDRIGVSTLHGSTLINIQFAASDPDLASTVLNALVERFTSEHGESKRELTVRAADWMSEKIPLLDASLARAEKQMDAFRRENGLVDVDGSVSLLNEMELSQANLELTQTRSELSEAMRIFEDMSDPEETDERLESLEMVRSDPLIQQAWVRKSAALKHRQKLSNRYGNKHPSMIDANAELASLDAEIAEQIDRIMATAAKRMELLNKQVFISEARIAKNKQQVMSVQEKRLKLRAFERDVEMQRRLSNQFYADTVAARSLAGFDVGSAVVVDSAVSPLQPYRPERIIVLMLVALSSSIFSMLFLFFYDHVDEKIRNTGDIKNKLGMSLLGVMPEFTSTGLVIKPGKDREPALMYQHSEVVAEAVNNVRTSLMTHSSSRVRDASVLLVTATQAGEGSTTAAFALAHSFARLERVLLIDCHLRRPAIAQMDAGADADKGLNSLIAGTTSIEDSVRRDALGGGFDVLCCEPDLRRSTAIVASRQFGELLNQLREQYEWIILDAAPSQRDSSSLVLGRLADAIVYVTRSHSTGFRTILRAVRRLRSADGHVAGVLINRVDPNRMVSQGGDNDYVSYCGDISYKEANNWDLVRETLDVVAERVRMAYQEFPTEKVRFAAAGTRTMALNVAAKLSSTVTAKVPFDVTSKLAVGVPSEVVSKLAEKVPSKLVSKVAAKISSGSVSELAAKVPSEVATKLAAKVPSEVVSKACREVNSRVSTTCQLARTTYTSMCNFNRADLSKRLVGLNDSAKESAVAQCCRLDLTGLRERAEPYRRSMVSTAMDISDRARMLAENRLAPTYKRESKARVLSKGAAARSSESGDIQTMSEEI